jgi:hypothetical protein
MPLLGLPNELLSDISKCLESEGEINAVAQANDCFYFLLNNYLYRHNAKSERSALSRAVLHSEEATVQSY